MVAPASASDIAARSSHAVALRSDGAVFSWGADTDGALATNRVLLRTTPVALPNLPAMKMVTTQTEHVVALDMNGRVWTWGDNSFGQLGVRVQRTSTLPGRVKGLSRIVKVGTGWSHSIALRDDGTVWAWGNIGLPGGESGPVPTQVQGLTGIADIAMGSNHLLARRSDGTVLALGKNEYGQLGNGTRTDSLAPVAVLGLANVVAVGVGNAISLAVTADGKAWYWGRSGFKPGDNGLTTPQQVTGLPGTAAKLAGSYFGYLVLQDGSVWRFGDDYTPVQVVGLPPIVDVALEDPFTLMARATDGRLFALTDNQLGEAGVGHTNNLAFAPTQVPISGVVTSVAVGRHSVLATTQEGKLWAWARNSSGSLGLGESISYSAPRRIAGLPADVVQVSTGLWNSAARTAAGNVWMWGSNANGELGDGTRTPRSVPLQSSITGVAQVSMGRNLVLYRKTNGEVWFSGLVAGDPIALVPAQKTGLPPASVVAAGGHHALVIDATGALWGWGDNAYGQVDGSATPFFTTPVKITAITGKVVQAVADYWNTMALTEAGEVWAWGRNVTGVLGDGTYTDNRAPRKVAGVSGVVEIAMSNDHVLARRSDGTVLSWGNGNPLGRGGDMTVPGAVEGIASVARIAAGDGISLAMRADGSVWSWGENCLGFCSSLGDGTFVTRNRPVLVLAEDGSGSVDAGNWFLDLEPSIPNSIPPGSVRSLVAVASSRSGSGVLNVDAGVNVKAADRTKSVGVYVTGLVPAAFLKQVPTAPGAHALAAGIKADELILVNLTPAGWTIAANQLAAYTTGTGNAFLNAGNLLVNVDPSSIPGARFCIGYGESVADMLNAANLGDFVSLGGAAGSALEQPCLKSGVYVDGPSSSAQGSSIALRAAVVGQSPTGTVRFREQSTDVSGDLPVQAASAGISIANLAYVPPASNALELVFSASYSGDGSNLAQPATEVPLRHRVQPVAASTSISIEGPLSSEIGEAITLRAFVRGKSPTGFVQFRRNGNVEGTPAPLVADQATILVVGLGVGSAIFSADYLGDAGNLPASTLAQLTHRVDDIYATTVALASTANPTDLGAQVTITASVTGTNPSGTVTLREGTDLIGTQALSGGAATFVLSALGAGVHVFTADYSGDGTNRSATSNAVFQHIQLVPNAQLAMSVAFSGAGSGTVSSTPGGLDCTTTCVANFPAGTAVTLTAAPAAGSVFLGWTGACTGAAACTVPMNAARNVGARFELAGTGVVVAPTSRAFGGQSINTTSALQTVTVTNNSSAAIAVTSVGPNSGFNGTHDCSSVAVGASCTVAVTFTPAVEGAVTASLALQYTQGGGQRFTVIGATGTGEKTLVTHYYRSVLQRAPDPGGKAYWEAEAARVQALGLNVNEAWFAMAQAFYFSVEYRNQNRSNSGFVTDLYNTFFNRVPDAGGLAHWAGLIDQGVPREVVLAEFMFSAEFRNFSQAIFGNPAVRAEVNAVTDFYRGLLARLPDSGGFNYWLARFRAAQCAGPAAIVAEVEAISSQFTLSAEYAARARSNAQYVGDLYNAFLRRGGDVPGVESWISQVNSGAVTREQLRVAFKNSPEFQARVSAIIQQGCIP